MQISDVRVKLINVPAERLKAVCTVTFDEEFVVRDVKVVDGTNGLFVAMPSRKLSLHCPTCKHKNHLRARYCNECGGKLPPQRAPAEDHVRSRLHKDIAHPITVEFREVVQQRVIEAYHAEVERSTQPGYQPPALEPVADSEENPRPVVEPEERATELSEYDAMIAALRGGGSNDGPERHDDGGREPRRDRRPQGERGNMGTVRSDRGRERGRERGPAPRDGGERGNRSNGSPRRDGNRSENRRENSSSRGRETHRDRHDQSESHDRHGTPPQGETPARSLGAPRPRPERVMDQAAPPPAPRPSPSPPEPRPRPQPIVNAPAEEEDVGFGQGIL